MEREYGYEYVQRIRTMRQGYADRLRWWRNETRQLPEWSTTTDVIKAHVRNAWRAYAQEAPSKLTWDNVVEELLEVIEYAGTPVPQITGPGGYSMCGQEDYEAEQRDEASMYAHTLVEALIELRRDEYYR